MINRTTTHPLSSTTVDMTHGARRRNATIVVATLAALGFSGCSAIVDRATERVVEEGVERVVEADTGEDVDLDFDADGSFSIETEDGSFSFDDDGSFQLETEDGTFTGAADDTGYVISDDDGVVVDANIDTSADGQDAIVSFETEDGTVVSGTGDDAWGVWPAELARPEFTTDAAVFGTSVEDDVFVIASGGVEGADPQTVVDAYVDSLDGFTTTSQGSVGDDLASVVVENGEYTVSVVGERNSATGTATLAVTVTSL